MAHVIVDTNIPKVANGEAEHASLECVQQCLQQIRQIRQSGILVLDDRWFILREYQKELRSTGQPGVGDAFLKWVLRNQATRCMRITITPLEPDNPDCTDFVEFPDDPALAKFDPADRKFVAVAIASQIQPLILNATDSDWWHFRAALEKHNVRVEFVCEDQIQRWQAS